jgi:hypothetical protein
MAQARGGQKVVTGIRTILDPERDFVSARRRRCIVRHCRARTPAIRICSWHTQECSSPRGDAGACQSVLDQLPAKNPNFSSADGHLIYVRALEDQNKTVEALQEYEALENYYPGLEAKVRHALYLQKLDRVDEARMKL